MGECVFVNVCVCLVGVGVVRLLYEYGTKMFEGLVVVVVCIV